MERKPQQAQNKVKLEDGAHWYSVGTKSLGVIQLPSHDDVLDRWGDLLEKGNWNSLLRINVMGGGEMAFILGEVIMVTLEADDGSD